MKALMHVQVALPFLGRTDGASVAPSAWVKQCKTYREAVRMSWAHRRIKRMTMRQLAAEGEFYAQHVGDWLNPDDKPKRRDLPAAAIAAFESLTGNTIVSQWIAGQSKLTILEEMMASKAA